VHARRERPGPTDPPQRARPRPQHALETFGHIPAFILDRRADVLAADVLACAVLTHFGRLPAVKHALACSLSVYRT
jgi:hypothetical protein